MGIPPGLGPVFNNMRDMLGKDLSGWRVEIWYELRLPHDEYGGYDVGGYFTDKDLAIAATKGKGWYGGGNGKVADVTVLTEDGITGYINTDQRIVLSDQNSIRAEIITKTAGLTAEEKKLLGFKLPIRSLYKSPRI